MGQARNGRRPPGRTGLQVVCGIFLAAMVASSSPVTFAATPPTPPGEPSPILVSYSFDDGLVDTGPDTFRVFENARGTVQLSRTFRVSGVRSVEIRDRAGDGDFPELQGRFPLRRDGTLFLHFSLLVADPSQELNVALAGPAGFRLGRDGIAFWLAVRDGALVHVSDSIPRRLLEVEPFTWYAVDLEYRVARGVYDLRVRREGEAEPRVVLDGVPNAASHAGSAVDTFSFIGDPGTDRSNVDYYVDDVVVASTREAAQGPFVAPGRRHTFVDLLERYRGAPPRLECVPAEAPGDFGLAAAASSGRETQQEPRDPRELRRWDELAGDAAFAAGRFDDAERLYRAAAGGTTETRLLLKLSDVAWKRGDHGAERRLREAVYGSLRPATPRADDPDD